MELYNFFSEPINDKDKLDDMIGELKEICHFVEIVCWPKNSFSNINDRYSIIGQMYGEDTNGGDIDLMVAMRDVKYTWFDAFCPQINNIKCKL